MVVPHLRTALAFGGAVFRGCALRFASCARHSSPSGLRCSQAHSRRSLLHWAHRRLLQPLAAPPLSPSLGLLRPVSRTARGLRAPPPVSAKILRIFGRGNCKEAIFALENGIFRRGVLRAPAPLNSAWSFHCARKLACGSPCFIGLTTACFRHWRRPSCAPALRLRGVPCLRTSCARHFSPSGLHLFASICSRKMPEMTYTPSFLI